MDKFKSKGAIESNGDLSSKQKALPQAIELLKRVLLGSELSSQVDFKKYLAERLSFV